MEPILQAIAALPREQQTEWREIHGTDDSAPLSLDWRTLPRWTPEHREAVATALHDWCLSQSDACAVLRAVTASSRRVGVRLSCAVARQPIPAVLYDKDTARSTIETVERWVRGEASLDECRAAADSSCDARIAFASYVGQAAYALSDFDASEDDSSAAADYVQYAASSAAAYQASHCMRGPWGEHYTKSLLDLCGVIAREMRTALDEAAKGYEKEVSK